MKKVIISLVLALVCMTTFAQTYRYRSSSYAFGSRNSYGSISWGNWQRSGVVITVDTDEDFIQVYSSREQNYVIVDSGSEYTDNSGGRCIDFEAIDEEGIRCTIKLRTQRDGTAQLYAYYNDVAWVYSGLHRM